MKIKVNKDIEKYEGGVFWGLSLRMCIHIAICFVLSAGIILVLYYNGVPLALGVYIATPVVVPIAYNGFYNKNGMTFFEVQKRKFRLIFGRNIFVYESTEKPMIRKGEARDESKNKKVFRAKKGK